MCRGNPRNQRNRRNRQPNFVVARRCAAVEMLGAHGPGNGDLGLYRPEVPDRDAQNPSNGKSSQFISNSTYGHDGRRRRRAAQSLADAIAAE